MNLYQFVQGNPLLWFDAYGLKKLPLRWPWSKPPSKGCTFEGKYCDVTIEPTGSLKNPGVKLSVTYPLERRKPKKGPDLCPARESGFPVDPGPPWPPERPPLPGDPRK
jgi:hypothetical protein